MDLSSEQKQEFFAIAKQKGYLSDDTISQWSFLPVKEFVVNKHLTDEQYRDLVKLVTGQEIVDQQAPPQRTNQPVYTKPQQPSENKLLAKRPGSPLLKSQQEEQPIVNPSQPHLENWKQQRVEEGEKRLQRDRNFVESTFQRGIIDQETNLRVLIFTILFICAVVLEPFRIFTVVTAFCGMWIALFLKIQSLLNGKPIANEAKHKEQRADGGQGLVEEYKIERKEMFLERLETPDKRIKTSAIVLVVITLSSFTIHHWAQLLVALGLGAGAAHVIENNKGRDGKYIFAGALLLHLSFAAIFTGKVVGWTFSQFGFLLCCLSFLFATTFGEVLTRNIEKYDK